MVLTTKGIDDMSLKYFVEAGRHCMQTSAKGGPAVGFREAHPFDPLHKS